MSSREKRIWTTNLDPIKILQIFSEDDYESLIEDWQRSYLGKKYSDVERLGGSGDKGRDVICTDILGETCIYQCKHYDRKLNKSDVLLEIGKICYYCYNGDYKIPKKYYFVSPQGVTTYVRDMLLDPIKLKKELIDNWDNNCSTKITSKEKVILEGKFLEFIDSFNFSIFNYISPKNFLSDFKTTPYYTKWFGDIVKPRKMIEHPPEKIETYELRYINKILEAYSEHLGKNIEDQILLEKEYPDLYEHFNRQRLYFFSAEYLAAFSRETYPPEDQFFEKLKDEMYHGIIDEIENDAKNGFERLKKVLLRSRELILSSNNPLQSEVNIKDRQGLCHHLANERDDVKWKR